MNLSVTIGIRLLKRFRIVVGNERSVVKYTVVFCNTSLNIVARVNNSAFMGNNFQYVLETLCLRKYND